METDALLLVAVFGIDQGQFLQTTPCERRFRTDAHNGARPCYAPTEPFLVPLLYGSCDFYCTGGQQGADERNFAGRKMSWATCLRRLKNLRFLRISQLAHAG